jgi:hypothetical protein
VARAPDRPGGRCCVGRLPDRRRLLAALSGDSGPVGGGRGGLPPDFLVDNLPCPLFAFWGEEDEEIAKEGGVRLLAAGLDRHGLKHASFPGHDHEGMLAHINEAAPSVLAWFDGLPRAE